jgi:hypothetical protein
MKGAAMPDNHVTATTSGQASAETKKREPHLERYKNFFPLGSLIVGALGFAIAAYTLIDKYANAPQVPRLTATADAFDYATPFAHIPIAEKVEPDAIPTPLHDNEILRFMASSTKFIKISVKNNGKKTAKGVKVVFNEGDCLYLLPSQEPNRSNKSIVTIGDMVAGQSEAVNVWGDAKLSEKMSIIHDDDAFDLMANRGEKKKEPYSYVPVIALTCFVVLIVVRVLYDFGKQHLKKLMTETIAEKAEGERKAAFTPEEREQEEREEHEAYIKAMENGFEEPKQAEPPKKPEPSKRLEPSKKQADEQNKTTAIWQQIVKNLDEEGDGLLADWAKLAKSEVIAGEEKLRLTFFQRDAFAQKACERNDRREKLEKALDKVTGGGWKLEFASAPDPE